MTAMLVIGLGASLAFSFIWLPRVTKILVDLETREIHRQMDIMGDGLLPFLLQNQYAATYEMLDSVLAHQDNWRQIILRRPDGRLIYPLTEPDPVQGKNLLNSTHVVALRGNNIAVLEATVDLSGPISLLTKEARTLGLLAFGMFAISMLALASFLEAMIGRRLRTLEIAASEMAAGNFNAALPKKSNDEVGVMTRGFSQMRQQIYDNEQSLIAARKVAEQAAIAKTQFLATMSHEIRTPMNGVVPIADLLLETELDAIQSHYVRTIQTSGRALLAIIDDILDLSRLEAGRISLIESEFDLVDLVEDICKILGPRAFAKGVQLTAYVPRELHGCYLADGERIRQVLLNLVGNAVKFTSDGAILIEVARTPDDDTRLQFTINDTGIGIEERDLDRIFDRFSQVDGSASRVFGGSGLGLSISKRLVEVMHGDISAQSKVGLGSTFRFCLPIKRIREADSITDPLFAKTMTALVVRSDPSAIDGITYARVLNDWSLSSKVTTGLIDLKTTLDDPNSAFDIVIFDQATSEIDQTALLVAIKQSAVTATLPMLVATTPIQASRSAFEGIECAEVLIKPIPTGSLVRAVRQHLLPSFTQNAASADTPAHQSVGHSKVPPGRQLSILVADDNLINQDVARAILSGLGHKTAIVSTGSEAVAAVQTETYDLVLMDVHMPEMDGLGATKIIRDLSGPVSEIPIVALTASATQDDIDMCRKAGMDQFLAKPVTIAKVRDLINGFAA